MDKYAAAKIASDYYNLGVQLALQGPGLTKTAAPSGKQIAAMLGGVAASPAALEEVGRVVGSRALGGNTGWMQSQAIRKLLGLKGDFVPSVGVGDLLGSIPSAIKHDASRLLSGKGLNYSHEIPMNF